MTGKGLKNSIVNYVAKEIEAGDNDLSPETITRLVRAVTTRRRFCMLAWLKTQGWSVILGFLTNMLAEASDDILDKIRGIIQSAYEKALKTEKEWDDPILAFFHDLLSDEPPMFMTELKEALVVPLTGLYRICVANKMTTLDEHLVLILFDAIGKPVPQLDLAEG